MLKRIIFCAALLALSACASSSKSNFAEAPRLIASAESSHELLAVNSILIYPPDFSDSAREAAPNLVGIYEELCKSSAEQLDLRVLCDRELVKSQEWKITQSNTAAALERARKLGQDAVLLTRVNQYVERQGSRFGSVTPATVSFSMQLLRAADGRSVWNASYFFRDVALTEDLLRARGELARGESALWRESREVLHEGVGAAFSDLTQKRGQQFS